MQNILAEYIKLGTTEVYIICSITLEFTNEAVYYYLFDYYICSNLPSKVCQFRNVYQNNNHFINLLFWKFLSIFKKYFFHNFIIIISFYP